MAQMISAVPSCPQTLWLCTCSWFSRIWDKILIKPINSKEISPEYSLEGLMLKLKLQYFDHLMWKLTHWKRPWCWERLKAGGEGDDRGWDGWMASPTWWTWVWATSRSWWWIGKPGMLQYMGLQRVRHDWATELTDSMLGQKPFRHLFGKSSLTFYLFSAWLKEWYITGREINQNARAIIALLCFLSLIFYSCNTLRFCKTQDCCGCLWHSLPFFHWTVVDTNIIHGLWLAFKSLSGVHSVGWGALTLMFYPSSFT